MLDQSPNTVESKKLCTYIFGKRDAKRLKTQ